MMRGDEHFEGRGAKSGMSMLDFWQFQFSNVYTMQEHIAEFLVSKALGIEEPINRNGWSLFDILYKNLRIEVKQTSYYYPWQKVDGDGKNKINNRRTFDISPAYSVYKDRTSELKRQSDIYVFCVNTGTTRESADPLNLDNWDFYVVPTAKINKICQPLQKTISLSKVQKLAWPTSFDGLEWGVESAAREGKMITCKAPIAKISRHRIDVDGKGVCTLVSFYGCPLDCAYCLNPHLKKVSADTRLMTPEELYDEVKQDDIYFQSTGGGITFSGGEPLLYDEFIEAFARLCKRRWKIRVETSLSVTKKNLMYLLNTWVDEWIVDIKVLNANKYAAYTNSDAYGIMIENLKVLSFYQEKTLIRVPDIEYPLTDEESISKSIRKLKRMGFRRFDKFSYVVDPELRKKMFNSFAVFIPICGITDGSEYRKS